MNIPDRALWSLVLGTLVTPAMVGCHDPGTGFGGPSVDSDQPHLDARATRSDTLDSVFRTRPVLPFEPADVNALPGAVIFRLTQHDSAWYFDTFDGVKSTMEKSETLLFEDIVDSSAALQFAVHLLPIGSDIASDDKAELSIRELYILRGPARETVQSKIDAVRERLMRDGAAEAFYCRSIKVGTLTSRKYHKVSAKGGVTGPLINVNGTYYDGSAHTSTHVFIVWDGVPIRLSGELGPSDSPTPPSRIRELTRWRAKE